jgi:hypothetical protein
LWGPMVTDVLFPGILDALVMLLVDVLGGGALASFRFGVGLEAIEAICVEFEEFGVD